MPVRPIQFLAGVTRSALGRSAIGLLLVAAGAAAMYGIQSWWNLRAGTEASQADVSQANAKSTSVDPTLLVELPRDQWSAARIKLGQARRDTLMESVWVTGKVSLNEDRVAHIYPLVDGIVREVRVKFGQEVRAGDVLAILDCREIGTAKLELVKNRLALQFATISHERNETVQTNTLALIEALKNLLPVLQIEEKFRDQPMGDYRQQLVTGYSRLNQTRADYDRILSLSKVKVLPDKDLIKARTDFESAEATYQAALESVKYAARQQVVASEQKIKEAQAAQSVSESLLLILGYSTSEIATMNPIAEGEAVAHYPVKASFDGTIIAKDIVLEEQVSTHMQLFQIADLTRVWLRVDVFEKDISLLASLAGQEIDFKAGAYPDRVFHARVMYTGDVVDESTRSVRMVAIAENPDRLLKPGMFVEANLPRSQSARVLQIPHDAVLQHDGQTFVFVHRQGDKFERREVSLGRAAADRVEVLSGLSASDPLVIEGAFALKSEMLRELMTGE